MNMNPDHIVEAALFSAGRPVSIDEIVEETGMDRKQIKAAVERLRKTYQERDTALEVGPAGAKWAMQVRSAVSESAARFAPMEIPKKVLKTLALIAYHQPLKQSDLKDMIGSKVYDHVGELVERGLVRARPEGVTKLLATTPAFPEYFGIAGEDTEEIRGQMAKLVGLPPPEKKPVGSARAEAAPMHTPKALEEFAQAALAAAQAEAQEQGDRPARVREETAAVPEVPSPPREDPDGPDDAETVETEATT